MTPNATYDPIFEELKRLRSLAPDQRRSERVRTRCRTRISRMRKGPARTDNDDGIRATSACAGRRRRRLRSLHRCAGGHDTAPLWNPQLIAVHAGDGLFARSDKHCPPGIRSHWRSHPLLVPRQRLLSPIRTSGWRDTTRIWHPIAGRQNRADDDRRFDDSDYASNRACA